MNRSVLSAACGLACLAGCHSTPRRCAATAATPITQLVDLHGATDPTVPVIDTQISHTLAEKIGRPGRFEQAKRKPFEILALSGGGSYGAYSAGVLVGWTETGQRPTFDVVTGVSTGAIVAVLAFLGPDADPELRRFYTTVANKDIYTKKNELTGILSDSLYDTQPLANLIAKVIDDTLLTRVAAEYAKGRRLYVGTTHLDSRRLVQWDMGAIAARGTPQDLDLFRKLVLASASIPGYFPPVYVPVAIDGKVKQELHVDGGVTASLFFVPPRVSKEEYLTLGETPLAGSNLYVIVAGKLYADPACVERRLVPLAGGAISSLLYAQTRGDLFQMFALCLATKMNYYLTAVPASAPVPADATSFDPVEMTALFEVGRKSAVAPWRSTPPGLEVGEAVPPRAGTVFVSPAGSKPDVVQVGGTK